MSYLCEYHRNRVRRSVAAAQHLWADALWRGERAYWQGEWRRAGDYFGLAFTVAKLRLDDVSRGLMSGFGDFRLLQSCSYFRETMRHVDCLDEAEVALRFTCRHVRARAVEKQMTAENKNLLGEMIAR